MILSFSGDFSLVSSLCKYCYIWGMPGPLQTWWISQQGAARGQELASETDSPHFKEEESNIQSAYQEPDSWSRLIH